MEVPIERADCLAMIWPSGTGPAPVEVGSEYTLQIGVVEADFKSVQTEIGFVVTDEHWNDIARLVANDDMVFFTSREGRPIAVAVAQNRSTAGFELGWVAVAPAHRGQGLGRALCRVLTHRLVLDGNSVFLSTRDDRLHALRLYFALGFHPVFRAQKVERWRTVCSRLSVSFEPKAWNWPRSRTP